MNLVAETGHPKTPQFVSHGIPIIDTLDEKYGIWIPANIIRRTPNINHLDASEHDLGQGTTVVDTVAYCIKKKYKLIFKFGTKILNFKASAKILK